MRQIRDGIPQETDEQHPRQLQPFSLWAAFSRHRLSHHTTTSHRLDLPQPNHPENGAVTHTDQAHRQVDADGRVVLLEHADHQQVVQARTERQDRRVDAWCFEHRVAVEEDGDQVAGDEGADDAGSAGNASELVRRGHGDETGDGEETFVPQKAVYDDVVVDEPVAEGGLKAYLHLSILEMETFWLQY